MAAWLRILANPKVLKRFLGTRAGKKAALKYGRMLLESKMIRDAVSKFMGRAGKSMQGNKEYAKLEKKYATLEKRVNKLEIQLESVRDNSDKMAELTFTLGRHVVEMQNLLSQMQAQYQQHVQQMVMANGRTR